MFPNVTVRTSEVKKVNRFFKWGYFKSVIKYFFKDLKNI